MKKEVVVKKIDTVNRLERSLLKTLLKETQSNVGVEVDCLQYLKVLRQHDGKYETIDVALAILALEGCGYVQKKDASFLSTICLTDLGIKVGQLLAFEEE